MEVDKYFIHFEKIASSLKWPDDVWTVLLQSVFVGKACEIYSALPVEQSSKYQVVKEAVLKAYELVPEAYCQKFCNSTKEEKQTFVEFACVKERPFDRWCASQIINGEYLRLRELLLIEEFCVLCTSKNNYRRYFITLIIDTPGNSKVPPNLSAFRALLHCTECME